MFRDYIDRMGRSWPVGVAALPFGLGCCFLVCFFPNAIEVYEEMEMYLVTSRWGGIETLFMLNSGVLGWVSVVVLEHRLGTVGTIVLLISLPWSLLAIAGGFGLGLLFVDPAPGSIWDMVGFSALAAVGASGLRTYLHDWL